MPQWQMARTSRSSSASASSAALPARSEGGGAIAQGYTHDYGERRPTPHLRRARPGRLTRTLTLTLALTLAHTCEELALEVDAEAVGHHGQLQVVHRARELPHLLRVRRCHAC